LQRDIGGEGKKDLGETLKKVKRKEGDILV